MIQMYSVPHPACLTGSTRRVRSASSSRSEPDSISVAPFGPRRLDYLRKTFCNKCTIHPTAALLLPNLDKKKHPHRKASVIFPRLIRVRARKKEKGGILVHSWYYIHTCTGVKRWNPGTQLVLHMYWSRLHLKYLKNVGGLK